jgi:V/A-type H+-transporting ATPase subunit I
MKRFYLATPTKYEDRIIEDLGALGFVQLISDYTVNGFKKVDSIEKCEKYVKLQQRMSSILSTLLPEKAMKKSLAQSLMASFRKSATSRRAPATVSLDQIESEVSETETRLDERLSKLEKLRSELKNLRTTKDGLLILQKHGLRPDGLGDFDNIFVRAGFLNRTFSAKLGKYVEGTSVRFSEWHEKREDDFVVVLGLNQDKAYAEDTLTRLNFAPLILPGDVNPDLVQALEQNEVSTCRVQQEINDLEHDVRGICEAFQKKAIDFDPVVGRALAVENARGTFSRTETLSLVHGWIPSNCQESLAAAVQASTNGAAFLKFEDPKLDEQAPVQISNRSIAGSFELFTRLRGTPQYGEIDPTPIVTLLFTIMYGMMFGDIGQGVVLLAVGVILSRLQRGFMGIPSRAMGKLGGILASCGISAIFFGTLYGEFFLSEAFHPIFVNPMQSQTTMIVVALLFGVVQLGLGLVLKIVNLLRTGARIAAAFGGVRLVYYVTGVALAVKYASSLSFSVFTENLWLTVTALVCLIVVFFSPSIEAVLRHEAGFGAHIMNGASEFIETFLSYLTNSISYVRLAAFAIAHSALGLSALILAALIGYWPGFIFMNFLALTIEALGVFIQCMRLTYYEFFTKFYSGTGSAYRPFSLPKFLGTVK